MTRPRKKVFGPLFYSTLVLAALVTAYSGSTIYGPDAWARFAEWRDLRSLGEGLRAEEPRLREAAAMVLSTKGSDVATPYLLAAARDPRGGVRALACRSLAGFGADPGISVPALIVAAGDIEEEVRLEAAQGLGRVAGHMGVPHPSSPGGAAWLSSEAKGGSIAALRLLLNDATGEVRAAAADALGEFDPGPTVASLVAAAGQAPRPRAYAPRPPGPAGETGPDPAVVADLVAATRDIDRAVRLASARAILKLTGALDPAATRALLALVADPEPVADRRAAFDLLKIADGDPYDRAIAALAGLLSRGDSSIRLDLIDCLKAAGPRAIAALPALDAVSGENDATLRANVGLAVVAIVGNDDPRALPTLIRIVSDPTLSVDWRQNALDAIRAMDPSAPAKVTPALIRQLADPVEDVRRAALDLLSQIIGDTPAVMPGPAAGR